jgi:DNA recombination protein RmuC
MIDTFFFQILVTGAILFVIGSIVGFFVGRLTKSRGIPTSSLVATRIGVLESLNDESRKVLQEKEATIQDLRSSLALAQKEKAISQTRLEESVKAIAAERKTLDLAQEKLVTTFQALSGESLKSNNKAFLELAKESLEVVLSDAKGAFGKKEESIKTIVKPLEDALKRYEQHVGDLEKSRTHAYANLETQIKSLLTSQQDLQKETGNLVSALRRPEVRGRWGEVTLKRVVELAGMSDHCDYHEQVSVTTDDGRIRPDMIVHLPAGRDVVLDSKVSLDAYLDAISEPSEDRKVELLQKHAQQVRRHMKALSEKGYWDQFPQAPEFVVMFMPGESFLSAALDKDPMLIEDGMQSRVIIATPTTLIALLRAIAYGWRQEQITKHAEEIASLGKELYDRFQPFIEHVNKTSSSLTQAVFSFNRMVNSLDRRVMVSVRKFKELGATGSEDLSEPIPIEQLPIQNQQDSTTQA